MSHDLVRVRAIRPHDTTEGMRAPGEEYERSKAEAEQLHAQGIVSPKAFAAKAPKAVAAKAPKAAKSK